MAEDHQHEDYAVYIINEYQIHEGACDTFLNHRGKGVKINHRVLIEIVTQLQQQTYLEITEQELSDIAAHHGLDYQQLVSVLMGQMGVIKPVLERKFPKIYLNIDEPLILEIVRESLCKQYRLEVVDSKFECYKPDSLVIFFRLNYTHEDFKALYQRLTPEVYVITAGVIHQLLIIDNLYFKNSGLPTHHSNLNQIMTYLNSDVPATKNNWLLFYRSLLRQRIQSLPVPAINAGQKAYVAYGLLRYAAQLTDMWQTPTPFEQLNWFWQIDLNGFNVHKEVAVLSPFSETEMGLNSTVFDQEVELST